MTTAKPAPLAQYRIVGMRENWIGINAGTEAARKVPGGCCWHCGTGIAVEVIVRHRETGKEHTIGSTCAERVGMDVKELKGWLAEKYATERNERSQAGREAARVAAEAQEAADTAAHGEHGSPTRFCSGCFCDRCRCAAPHGTLHRFHDAGCRCLVCIDAAVATGGYIVREMDVILDVATGEIQEARKVGTRYGTRWCVGNAFPVWLPCHPARRSTMAKKGFVEARAPYLVEVCGTNTISRWYKPVSLLGHPIFDLWGEPIQRGDEIYTPAY